jgi:hypothetical protein
MDRVAKILEVGSLALLWGMLTLMAMLRGEHHFAMLLCTLAIMAWVFRRRRGT